MLKLTKSDDSTCDGSEPNPNCHRNRNRNHNSIWKVTKSDASTCDESVNKQENRKEDNGFDEAGKEGKGLDKAGDVPDPPSHETDVEKAKIELDGAIISYQSQLKLMKMDRNKKAYVNSTMFTEIAALLKHAQAKYDTAVAQEA